MFGIDDLIEAIVAYIAGQAIQDAVEGAVEGLFKALLSFLVTVDELNAAVKELEAYINGQFAELRNDEMVVHTIAASDALLEYKNNRRDKAALDTAVASLQQAHGWLEDQLLQSGEDVLRVRFVSVLKFVTTDFACWYARAARDHHDRANLVVSIDRLSNYLTRAVAQIKKMQTVTVSDVKVTFDQDPREPGGPPPPVWWHAAITISCPAKGPDDWFDGGPSATRNDAIAIAQTRRASILAQYHADEQVRANRIYDPVAQLITALERIRAHVAH